MGVFYAHCLYLLTATSLLSQCQRRSPIASTASGFQTKSFPFLLARLQTMYTTGRTVEPLAFDRYLAEDGAVTLPSDGTMRWLRPDQAPTILMSDSPCGRHRPFRHLEMTSLSTECWESEPTIWESVEKSGGQLACRQNRSSSNTDGTGEGTSFVSSTSQVAPCCRRYNGAMNIGWRNAVSLKRTFCTLALQTLQSAASAFPRRCKG